VTSPPRTQEERTADTRAKLLDATIESILEVGYTQTTTRRIAVQAGVSAGAQAYHFPRRVDLVAAAAEHLIERRIEETRRRARRMTGPPEQRLPALLDLMWADFAGPIFSVVLKLWVAAADEPELYERLVAGERRMARAITDLASESLGDLAAGKDAEGKLLLIFSACRGLALTEQLEPREKRRRDQWPQLREQLLAALR
jgi:AcrR family transcriptional regulator